MEEDNRAGVDGDEFDVVLEDIRSGSPEPYW